MITVLIPYGLATPERDRNLDYVYQCWEATGWDVVVMCCERRPWSKGEALRPSWEWDLDGPVVVADADCLVDRDAVELAVARVGAGAPWATPHMTVVRIDERSTRSWIRRDRRPLHVDTVRPKYVGTVGGGVVVVDPDVWRSTPIDPRFAGWGGEDEAWGRALHTLHGPCAHVVAELYHLHHAHPAPHRPRWELPETEESRDLLDRYRRTHDRPAAMRALVDEYRYDPAHAVEGSA